MLALTCNVFQKNNTFFGSSGFIEQETKDERAFLVLAVRDLRAKKKELTIGCLNECLKQPRNASKTQQDLASPRRT